MNIRCPNCQTAFRVDPAKIPPSGVRARCAKCSATFSVKPPSAAPEPTQMQRPAGAAPPPAAPAPAAAAPPPAAPAPAAAAAAATSAPPRPQATNAPGAAAPAASGSGTGGADRAGAPATGGTATAARPVVFGSRDPNARAQRIARALVSDIVAYHPKRRDECLAAGTLRTEFREEIMKSWEEYVAQVGLDMAKKTPFFRNALNDILARGQQIF
jgi:predicted Zn finger-like uncharacterized protein